jgi:hypothetical protein
MHLYIVTHKQNAAFACRRIWTRHFFDMDELQQLLVDHEGLAWPMNTQHTRPLLRRKLCDPPASVPKLT